MRRPSAIAAPTTRRTALRLAPRTRAAWAGVTRARSGSAGTAAPRARLTLAASGSASFLESIRPQVRWCMVYRSRWVTALVTVGLSTAAAGLPAQQGPLRLARNTIFAEVSTLVVVGNASVNYE